jgi:hypothetical protein
MKTLTVGSHNWSGRFLKGCGDSIMDDQIALPLALLPAPQPRSLPPAPRPAP